MNKDPKFAAEPRVSRGARLALALLMVGCLLVGIAGPPARYVTREFPADRATIDIGSYHADDHAFRAATGWEPRVSLEQGIRRSLDWFRPRLAESL